MVEMCPLSGYCDLLKLTPAPISGDARGDSSLSTAISQCCTRPNPSPAAAPPRHDTATWTLGCYLATLRLDNGKRRKIHVVVPTMLNVASFMSEFLCLTVISDEMRSVEC